MSYLQASEISLNDVYDFAYNIAQEFEKIAHSHGIDDVKHLIDKVINILEILESSVKRIELLRTELSEFKSNNLQLSCEKVVSDNEKTKLKQIYEESEESWLAEIANLKSQLSIVKSDNDCLRNHLSLNKEGSSKPGHPEDSSRNFIIQDQENIILKLRQKLQQKDKQIQENIINIKTLKARVQELLEVNKNLHSKNQEAKKDISKLIVEKNDYKSELILQRKENFLLNESIDELVNNCLSKQKENQNISGEIFEENSIGVTLDSIDYRTKHEMELLKKIKKLQSELQFAKSNVQQSEESMADFNSEENYTSFSKIHKFFHLFLGVTTLSEFCWC